MMGSSGAGGPTDRLREFFARRGVLPIVGGLAVLVVVGVIFIAVASGGGGRSGSSASSGGIITPVAEATPEATIDLNRPTAVVPTVEAPPPGVTGGDKLVVQKVGIDAPLSYKKVGADGIMPDPNGPDDVAFYDFSSIPGLGGLPGVGGNVVLSGHVDYGRGACKNGTKPPPCEAVFYDLRNIRVGDEIEIQYQGKVFRYRVTSSQRIPANANAEDWGRIVSSTAQETITMITCDGTFNPSAREYNERRVVTGVRI